ncbi:MAG TPA: type I-E CRISPR-associated protein Cse1/CasA [Firmicutes bacterium]|jgi:CRISPR system Cascade subunit CasA|nr:type I-E CRISPR-associated protein Cse1/CasA [Bacillota bacterium]
MQDKAFNLLHEPWIVVLNGEGMTETVSLLTALERAHEFVGLAGELPTQDVTILRLLLAALYGTFVREDIHGNHKTIRTSQEALERWLSLWKLGRFPTGPIQRYLGTYIERFYLFHPKHPFYQVAFPEPPQDTDGKEISFTWKYACELAGDVAESGNVPRLFAGRRDTNKLSFAEAARWLLYTHAFGVAPAGSPGNKRVIKGYGLPWLSQLGIIWATGDNLFETLMFNFVLLDQRDNPWPVGDMYWEAHEELTADTIKDIAFHPPRSPAELYTMQFRRIRLQREERGVTGYELWSGIVPDFRDAFYEPMTVWRKKDNTLPKKHSSEKQMWRDFAAIFSEEDGAELPGVVRWIHTLQSEGGVQLPLIRFHTAGVNYTKNTAIEHVFADSLKINAGLLSELGEAWIPRISNLLKITDKSVRLLDTLASDLAKASGDSDGPGRRAGEAIGRAAKAEAYFKLDMPFRSWLAGIDPSKTDKTEAEQSWRYLVQRVLQEIGEEMVYRAGNKAMVGRWVLRRNMREPEHFSASAALAKFRNGLHKMLKGGLIYERAKHGRSNKEGDAKENHPPIDARP